MKRYDLQLGGEINYYPMFLSEEFSKNLFNELKGNETIIEDVIVYDKQEKPHELKSIALISPYKVKWVQVIVESYNKWITYPRFCSSMFAPGVINDNITNKKVYWDMNESWIVGALHDWTPLMKILVNYIEKTFGVKIPYCQMNYYHGTSNYIGYHCDNEMGDTDLIFSISLGITRHFRFRRKFGDDNKVLKSGEPELTIDLENGSLCVFNAKAGKLNYKHELPKGLIRDGHSKECISGESFICNKGLDWCGCDRINITFRTIN
jgi:hypothetical protein